MIHKRTTFKPVTFRSKLKNEYTCRRYSTTIHVMLLQYRLQLDKFLTVLNVYKLPPFGVSGLRSILKFYYSSTQKACVEQHPRRFMPVSLKSKNSIQKYL